MQCVCISVVCWNRLYLVSSELLTPPPIPKKSFLCWCPLHMQIPSYCCGCCSYSAQNWRNFIIFLLSSNEMDLVANRSVLEQGTYRHSSAHHLSLFFITWPNFPSLHCTIAPVALNSRYLLTVEVLKSSTMPPLANSSYNKTSFTIVVVDPSAIWIPSVRMFR